jgi:hypothetical protein
MLRPQLLRGLPMQIITTPRGLVRPCHSPARTHDRSHRTRTWVHFPLLSHQMHRDHLWAHPFLLYTVLQLPQAAQPRSTLSPYLVLARLLQPWLVCEAQICPHPYNRNSRVWALHSLSPPRRPLISRAISPQPLMEDCHLRVRAK